MYNLEMEFTKSLIKGKLIKRYKRFFTDVKLQKETVTAHCPNTGSMNGLLEEGNDVYLLPNNNPKRKLKYGLEIIKSRKNLVGVNTHMANKIAKVDVFVSWVLPDKISLPMIKIAALTFVFLVILIV